jgi:hypothetical protein
MSYNDVYLVSSLYVKETWDSDNSAFSSDCPARDTKEAAVAVSTKEFRC